MSDFNSSVPIRTEANGDAAVKIVDGGTPSQALAVDASGRVSVASIQDISAGTQTNDVKITLDSEAVVLGAGAALIGEVKVTDGTDDLAVNTDGSINGRVVDAAGDIMAVNADGSINVNLANSSSAVEYYDANVGSAIAAAATSNHDRVLAAAEIFTGFTVAASGKYKYEVRTDKVLTATFVTVLVGFGTGATDAPHMIVLPEPIDLASGKTIRIIRTNRDNQSQDLYSTIIGHAV